MVASQLPFFGRQMFAESRYQIPELLCPVQHTTYDNGMEIQGYSEGVQNGTPNTENLRKCRIFFPKKK